MRRQVWKGRRWTAWLVGLVFVLVTAATGCSDPDGEVPCESRDDCPDGQMCQDGVCVVPTGEVGCETEEDCPQGYLCHADGVCMEDEGETTCESHQDCSAGRLCVDEVCVIDPYGPFVEPVEIVDEEYQISVYAVPRVEQVDAEVRVFESSTGDSVLVDTGDINCAAASQCKVTSDLSHLLIIASSDNGQDVLAAPLSGDPLAVSGPASVFAESTHLPRFRGDGVLFQRDNGAEYEGYFQHFEGQEKRIGILHPSSGPGIQRSFDADPVSGRAVLFRPPDLERLEVYVGTIEDGVEMTSPVVTLDPTANYPRDAGSLYIGSTPASFSEDGRILAFATTGPNNHNNCQDDSDCTQTGHVCGDTNRCVAVEPTVNVVDLEFADNIGTPCVSHEACGPIHRCDSGSPDFDGGTCQPQRIVVGLPITPQQGSPRLGGCEATRNSGEFSFTNIDGPLTFGADGRIYFVGRRNCTRSAADPDDDVESNIPRTSIVAGHLGTGEMEEVFGNREGKDFSAIECWDHATQEVTNPDECILVINSAQVSPGGQDITYRASNPTVSSSLAATTFDVWRVRLDGEDPHWVGQYSGSHNVTNINVHAP